MNFTELPALSIELPALSIEPQKKKRQKKVNYDTTYCFSLSTSLLEALTQHASFNRKSISRVIREAITNELNSGRD